MTAGSVGGRAGSLGGGSGSLGLSTKLTVTSMVPVTGGRPGIGGDACTFRWKGREWRTLSWIGAGFSRDFAGVSTTSGGGSSTFHLDVASWAASGVSKPIKARGMGRIFMGRSMLYTVSCCRLPVDGRFGRLKRGQVFPLL